MTIPECRFPWTGPIRLQIFCRGCLGELHELTVHDLAGGPSEPFASPWFPRWGYAIQAEYEAIEKRLATLGDVSPTGVPLAGLHVAVVGWFEGGVTYLGPVED